MSAFTERLRGMASQGGDQEIQAIQMWDVASQLAQSLGITPSEQQIFTAEKGLTAVPPKSPADYGLSDQESDVLSVLDNLTKAGGKITAPRFYIAARQAGAANGFELQEAEHVVGSLIRHGLVDAGTRQTTKMGTEVAASHREDVKDFLLEAIKDKRAEVEEEFQRTCFDADGSRLPDASASLVAQYHQALSTLDEASAAVNANSPLIVDGSIRRENSAVNDVLNLISDDMALVGCDVVHMKADREQVAENSKPKEQDRDASRGRER